MTISRGASTSASTDGLSDSVIQEAIYWQVWLADEEIGVLVEATPVLKKFIEQSIIDLQLGLWFWEYKGFELEIYARIEAYQELIEKMDAMPNAKRDYEDKIEKDIKDLKDKIDK